MIVVQFTPSCLRSVTQTCRPLNGQLIKQDEFLDCFSLHTDRICQNFNTFWIETRPICCTEIGEINTICWTGWLHGSLGAVKEWKQKTPFSVLVPVVCWFMVGADIFIVLVLSWNRLHFYQAKWLLSLLVLNTLMMLKMALHWCGLGLGLGFGLGLDSISTSSKSWSYLGLGMLWSWTQFRVRWSWLQHQQKQQTKKKTCLFWPKRNLYMRLYPLKKHSNKPHLVIEWKTHTASYCEYVWSLYVNNYSVFCHYAGNLLHPEVFPLTSAFHLIFHSLVKLIERCNSCN